MKYTGKQGWQASYKDTFSLDYTLSPIILAALKKFREQSYKDYFGSPSRLNTDFQLPEDSDLGPIIWEGLIDHMIYAFDMDNEPKADSYGYTVDLIRGEKLDNGCTSVTFKVSSEEAKEAYYAAEKEHEDLCRKGRELFAKYYHNLWW